MTFQYFLLYKPYGYLSQFTKEVPEHQTLGDLYEFPKEVYPVGRLDKDSEGLLLLTDDKKLNHRLLDPKFQHNRTYWIQVEGVPPATAITKLEKGVKIRINKKDYKTLPAKAFIFNTPPSLPARTPPIRFRANIPTTWISLTLHEGKNRQVRRMCAKIGYPVLRLVRHSIENVYLSEMKIGRVENIEKTLLFKKLKLETGK